MAVDPMAAPTRSVRSRLVMVAIEVWPVIVVVFAALIALGHIVQSSWGNTFLYNSDSIVLPLIEQSIQRGEPFSWVFSSQNFLFPEGLLYTLSTIFTDSPRVALLVNALLNVVLLYILFRVIAHQLAHHSRHRFVEITIAVAATLLFVVFVLLEPADSINRSGIATLFMLTTYYYGVVLVGLFVISLTLWVTRLFAPTPWGRGRVIPYFITMTGVGALATFSNPLYLAQVLAPLGLTALILVFLRRLSRQGLGVLALAAACGTAIGILLRIIFRDMFSSSLGSYFSPSNIPTSIAVLQQSLGQMLSSAQGSLKLLLLVGMLGLTWAIFAYALHARSRRSPETTISNAEVFLVAFVTMSSLSLLAGQVLTGTTTTRYLEPLFVFPLLTLLSVGVYILRRLLAEVESAELRRNLSRFLLGLASAASVVIVAVGAVNVPPVVRASSGVDYHGADCFDEFVAGRDVSGVGSFWTVRALQLYGDSSGAVLQIDKDLTVYDWMINVASYRNRTFSYVIIDETAQVPVAALASLGEPRNVVACSGFDIYNYEGTRGENILTSKVERSVEEILKD